MQHKVFSHIYMAILIPCTWMLFAITSTSDIKLYFSKLIPLFHNNNTVYEIGFNQLKDYGFFLFILLSSILLFSTIGFLGKDSIFKNSAFQITKEPYSALVMQGINNRDSIIKSTSFSLAYFFSNHPVDNSGIPINDYIPLEGISNRDIISEEISTPDTTLSTDIIPEKATLSNESPQYLIGAVDTNYFNNVLFVSDSRTVGLDTYGNINNATFYAKISSTIYNIMDMEIEVTKENSIKKVSVTDSLAETSFDKIDLCVGINELGTGTPESFCKTNRSQIAAIQKLQPNALIIIQSIMHVTGEKSLNNPIFNNTAINDRNNMLATLADNQSIFYLDINTAFDDDFGNLTDYYTFDGVHLKASYYSLWEEFLINNGIIFE